MRIINVFIIAAILLIPFRMWLGYTKSEKEKPKKGETAGILFSALFAAAYTIVLMATGFFYS
jgi:small-conductance mechanosensitive channel